MKFSLHYVKFMVHDLFLQDRPWLNLTVREVLVTAKLIFRNKASWEENFEFFYFKYHIQNEIGQGEVGVYNIL